METSDVEIKPEANPLRALSTELLVLEDVVDEDVPDTTLLNALFKSGSGFAIAYIGIERESPKKSTLNLFISVYLNNKDIICKFSQQARTFQLIAANYSTHSAVLSPCSV
jgi:hypothetical protein